MSAPASAQPLELPAPSVRRGVWLVYFAVAAVVIALALWLAGDFGRTQSLEALRQRGVAAANLNATVLRAELDKQRSMPLVVSLAGDVVEAVLSKDQSALTTLNEKLEALNEGARASVIYVLDAEGLTLAASNWRSADSFVGNNYGFRPYYRDAMATGSAEHYALGTVSRRPGLYVARRIDTAQGPIGVAVVKVEFDAVEAAWREAGEPIYVTDGRGIVLVTGLPEWRFRTDVPIQEPEAQRIRESLLYGDASLLPLPIEPLRAEAPLQPVRVMLPGSGRAEPYLQIAPPVASTDWTLHQLVPVSAAVAAGEAGARAWALLIVVPVLALAAYFIWRSGTTARLAANNAAVQRELARRIAARTLELSQANQRLKAEMDERQQAEARERTMREDLMQANRLASLGQIAAGVAHEINQPVGAIRAYAENAQVLAERHELAAVKGNLGSITGLTERIGAITDELRAFSRKGSRTAEPTAVAAAIEGTLVLLGHRIRSHGVSLVTELPPAELRVMAQRIRLEQVLVNLVQNALEAVGGRLGAEIAIRCAADADEVRITIEDNGPGIAPEIMARLFVPFTTGKASGLGLGLVISNDIVSEFGGSLKAANKDGGGASFTVTLRRAA